MNIADTTSVHGHLTIVPRTGTFHAHLNQKVSVSHFAKGQRIDKVERVIHDGLEELVIKRADGAYIQGQQV
jgi:hypothetical protein